MPGHEGCNSLAVHWWLAGVVGAVDVVDGDGLVVVVAGAVVDGEVVFGFVVATEEPHPSAAIPAKGIRATTAIRLMTSMTTSRYCKRSHCVAGVPGRRPEKVPLSLAPSNTVWGLDPCPMVTVHPIDQCDPLPAIGGALRVTVHSWLRTKSSCPAGVSLPTIQEQE